MSDADRERWDARHAAGGPVAPVPPGAVMGEPGLLEAFPTAGRALEVACGRGGVTVWLARRGLAVDAVDISPSGLAAGARLAAAHGVDDRIRWIATTSTAGCPRSAPARTTSSSASCSETPPVTAACVPRRPRAVCSP